MKIAVSPMRPYGLLVLSVVALLLISVSVAPSLAAEAGTSDKFSQSAASTLLTNSLKHYIQALNAYNSGDMSRVAGLLQAAASNAKHVDPILAGLLGNFRNELMTTGNVMEEVRIAGQIAIIYNEYNAQYNWSSGTLFDTNDPLTVKVGRIEFKT